MHWASDPLDHEEDHLTPAIPASGARYGETVYPWELMQCDRSHTLLERANRCLREREGESCVRMRLPNYVDIPGYIDTLTTDEQMHGDTFRFVVVGTMQEIDSS